MFLFYCLYINLGVQHRVQFAEPVITSCVDSIGTPPTQEDESKETPDASTSFTEACSQASAGNSTRHQEEDLKSLFGAMHNTPSFDSASIGSKENNSNSHAAEGAALMEMIKDGKMDYDYISSEAADAENNLTPQEQHTNESAARSAAINLAHEVESKAGFHTAATFPPQPNYAQYPPPPNLSAPWPPAPTVIYQVSQTNINVQVNQHSDTNTVNQVDLSKVENNSTINCVDVSNITNNNTIIRDATSNTINHIDVTKVNSNKPTNLIDVLTDCANSNSALLTPLLDTPHNQNLAKDESAKLQLSSPKKSQIRFCPRDGQERDHTKNIALKAMHEGGAKGRMQKQQSISAQKKREQIKEVRKRRDIEMRSEAKANQEQHSERHSRRVRSDQADDGQSKYFRVQES